MSACTVCSGHHPHITRSRYGATVRCDCGWAHRTVGVPAAAVAWAGHIRDVNRSGEAATRHEQI